MMTKTTTWSFLTPSLSRGSSAGAIKPTYGCFASLFVQQRANPGSRKGSLTVWRLSAMPERISLAWRESVRDTHVIYVYMEEPYRDRVNLKQSSDSAYDHRRSRPRRPSGLVQCYSGGYLADAMRV